MYTPGFFLGVVLHRYTKLHTKERNVDCVNVASLTMLLRNCFIASWLRLIIYYTITPME